MTSRQIPARRHIHWSNHISGRSCPCCWHCCNFFTPNFSIWRCISNRAASHGNLRLVAHIAKKYYALPGDQDDLISIGTIGLIKAVSTFDSTRRARFSTYASRCIENEIRMQFRREKKAGPTVSLQETIDAGKEDSALTLSDLLQDSACMEENVEQKDDAQRLRALIETLPARERQLVMLRYGLAGQPPLTQLETAQLLGISRSYVSRLETHALQLLRQKWTR